MDALIDWIKIDSSVVRVFLVVFLALSLDLVTNQLLRRTRKTVERTKNYWDDALLEAALKPTKGIIWLLGLYFAVRISQADESSVLFTVITPLRDLGIITLITWFLARFIKRAEEAYVRQREVKGEIVDRTTVDAIAKLLRLSVVITAALVALQNLGYSISGVLAFGGVGGIAVGFAAKDLLSNFFGGLMVYLDRPFSVGDWVRSPDREIEGTVENIGWRLTVIRTFDKRPLYIPNSLFTQIVVENPSRMTNRRIFESFGIRYSDSQHMKSIVQKVKEMLLDHEQIDSSQTLIVNFDQCSPSSVDFFIYTYTHTTDWILFHQIKQDVMLKVMDIIEGHGAQMAFPTSTVHLQPEPMGSD